MGVKFSCRYTLQEIRDRWSNLLYNDRISKVALTACRNLHSKVKRRIYAEALFSEAELKKLESISSVSFLSVSNTHCLYFKAEVGVFNIFRHPTQLWPHLRSC